MLSVVCCLSSSSPSSLLFEFLCPAHGGRNARASALRMMDSRDLCLLLPTYVLFPNHTAFQVLTFPAVCQTLETLWAVSSTSTVVVRTYVVPTGTEEEHHARHVHVVPDGVGVSKIQPLCVVQYSFMFFIVSFNQKKYVQYGISMAETQRSSQSTVQYGYCRRTPYDRRRYDIRAYDIYI